MVSGVMELLGRGLRSAEAETREVEQFFLSMFGMMHETDLFLAEPQDGAYEVVSISTMQAQMENLPCVSCFFCFFYFGHDFTVLIFSQYQSDPIPDVLMVSPQTSPLNFQASVADKRILE